MIGWICRALALCVIGASLAATPASAIPVHWDVHPAQSSFKLAIPDQVVTVGTITATMRLRNQNNTTWTTNVAPVDGLLATNVGAGITSVQFLAGASSLTASNTGSYRPNPAAYDTAATDTVNTAGTFSNTSTAAAVYAARINAVGPIGAVNLGYISFDGVSYDVGSMVLPITGTNFTASTLSLGLDDARAMVDGIATLGTQVISDLIWQTGPILATNSGAGAGSIVACPVVSGSCAFGGVGLYQITVPVNMPTSLLLSGVNLNATATGTLVGYATIVPEPATLGVLATGLVGLGILGRRSSRAEATRARGGMLL